MQSTTKVGASVFGGGANASQAFLTTLYLTHGTTSRGRIGIDANLRAVTISRPWFTDAADKAVMVTAATEYLSAMKQGGLSKRHLTQTPTKVLQCLT